MLEDPEDTELFVMFADGTSGKETYGAGRFMYVPMPEERRGAPELQQGRTTRRARSTNSRPARYRRPQNRL